MPFLREGTPGQLQLKAARLPSSQHEVRQLSDKGQQGRRQHLVWHVTKRQLELD